MWFSWDIKIFLATPVSTAIAYVTYRHVMFCFFSIFGHVYSAQFIRQNTLMPLWSLWVLLCLWFYYQAAGTNLWGWLEAQQLRESALNDVTGKAAPSHYHTAEKPILFYSDFFFFIRCLSFNSKQLCFREISQVFLQIMSVCMWSLCTL